MNPRSTLMFEKAFMATTFTRKVPREGKGPVKSGPRPTGLRYNIQYVRKPPPPFLLRVFRGGFWWVSTAERLFLEWFSPLYQLLYNSAAPFQALVMLFFVSWLWYYHTGNERCTNTGGQMSLGILRQQLSCLKIFCLWGRDVQMGTGRTNKNLILNNLKIWNEIIISFY